MSVSEQLDTCSAAGRMVLNILASVSQEERRDISEHTKDALAYKKAHREQIRGVPYG
jgi:site-specific DNA recombinase